MSAVDSICSGSVTVLRVFGCFVGLFSSVEKCVVTVVDVNVEVDVVLIVVVTGTVVVVVVVVVVGLKGSSISSPISSIILLSPSR